MVKYTYTTTEIYVSQLALEIKDGIGKPVAKFIDTDSPVGWLNASGTSIFVTGSNGTRKHFVGPGGDDNLKVYLNNPLSTPDKSSLDTIITTHTPDPNYPIPTGSL